MKSERALVFLIGAVQFVNILDFVMVMPLGPDFARALGIPTSQLGWVGGSYTAAAAASGFACSFFLDRFDRKAALVWAMAGLAVGTLLGGFAWDFPTLLCARIVAGAFGGPATSVAFSIIADAVPPERRGRAMGAVMGAFAFASIAGVPAGLELARLGAWQWPFFGTALLGVIVSIGASVLLPSMRGHLATGHTTPRLSEVGAFLARPEVISSYAMTAFSMAGGFILVPNISAYIQGNLGFAREHIGMLYTVGGFVSFFATRIAGKCADRFGAVPTGGSGVALLGFTIYIGFILVPPPIPIWGVFMLFMLAMGFRNVAHTTLASKVPRLHERAQFMSLQSTVQNLASSAGAFASANLLAESANHALLGMPLVASLAIAMNFAVPVLMALVEKQIDRRSIPLASPDERLEPLPPG